MKSNYSINLKLIRMENETKLLCSTAFILVVCLLFTSCNKGPIEATGQIKKANELFMNAVSTGDINALTNLYTVDAKLFPANSEVINGQNAISGFWAATLKMGIKKVSILSFPCKSPNQKIKSLPLLGVRQLNSHKPNPKYLSYAKQALVPVHP